LIRALFADNARVRIAAAQNLIEGWGNETSAVRALVDFATQNMDNSNGVYNTVVVLNEFSRATLEAHRQTVLEFLEAAKEIGPKTAARVETLVKRLGGETGTLPRCLG